jgi:hypothetical protein
VLRVEWSVLRVPGSELFGLREFIELLEFVGLLSLMESRRSRILWTFFSTRSSQFAHEENGIHCLKFST